MTTNNLWFCPKCKNTYSFYIENCPNCNIKQHTVYAKDNQTEFKKEKAVLNNYNIEYRIL